MIADKRLVVPSREVSGPAVASTAAATITTGTPPYKSEWRSSKTRPRHLEREAIVYVRQSTPQQIVEHGESLSRQYALRDRAAALGWPPPNVLLIDDDLGLSGRGSDDRPGFQPVARPRPSLHYLGPIPGQSATVVGKPASPGNEGHTWRRLGVVDRSGILRALRPQDVRQLSIDPPRSLLLLTTALRADR